MFKAYDASPTDENLRALKEAHENLKRATYPYTAIDQYRLALVTVIHNVISGLHSVSPSDAVYFSEAVFCADPANPASTPASARGSRVSIRRISGTGVSRRELLLSLLVRAPRLSKPSNTLSVVTTFDGASTSMSCAPAISSVELSWMLEDSDFRPLLLWCRGRKSSEAYFQGDF